MMRDPRAEFIQGLDHFKPAGPWTSVTYDGIKVPAKTLWMSRQNGIRQYGILSCPSTMDLAWALSGQGRFPENSWVIAGTQVKGRGQLGREWVSPPGNLFATIRLPDGAGNLGSLLTLGLALVVVEVLAEFRVPAEIKWPNDILVGRTKVGGILIEERQGILLAGLGLNLVGAPGRDGSGKEFRVPAGCLSDFGLAVDLPDLWNLISSRFGKRLLGWLADPDCIREMMESNLAYKGEAVVIRQHPGRLNGPARILGMGSQGGLRIETALGEGTLRSGQITPQVI